MSRLLFAAARGARIQYRYPTWVDPDLWDDGNTQLYGALMAQARYKAHLRIHPDDEHLQYGPISSALREFAEKGREPYTVSGYAAMQIFRYECWYRFVLRAEWPHAQMFALILAEALADEGM